MKAKKKETKKKIKEANKERNPKTKAKKQREGATKRLCWSCDSIYTYLFQGLRARRQREPKSSNAPADRYRLNTDPSGFVSGGWESARLS
jgi:hypothetical protein